MEEQSGFEGWAILELMGHRRLGGRVSEATIGGASFLRIDVPTAGQVTAFTQFYAPGSIYAITPATEEIATRMAASIQHRPVSEYDLPRLVVPGGPARGGGDDDSSSEPVCSICRSPDCDGQHECE